MKSLLFVLPFLLLGCCGPAQVAMVGVKANWGVIGPRYKAYVEADPVLKARPDIKADWLKTAEYMDRIIAEASK